MAGLVVLSPSRLEVEPGGAAVCTVSIRNTSPVVDQFSVSVLGDAQEWARVEPPVLSLFPDAEGAVVVTFSPPRAADIPSGSVPFAIRVVASEDPDGSVVEEGELGIGGFSELSGRIIPRTAQGKKEARTRVQLDNAGNRPIEVELSATDPDEALVFDVRPRMLTVAPGRTATAAVRVAARAKLGKGSQGPRAYPYQVRVDPDTGVPLMLDAAFNQKAGMGSGFVVKMLAGVAAIGLLAIILPGVLKNTGGTNTRELVQQTGNETPTSVSGSDTDEEEEVVEEEEEEPEAEIDVKPGKTTGDGSTSASGTGGSGSALGGSAAVPDAPPPPDEPLPAEQPGPGETPTTDTTSSTTAPPSVPPGPVTVVSTGSVSPGTFSSVRVLCPAGMKALNGGVDPDQVLTVKVTSSAPVFDGGNKILFSQPNGNNPAAIGWQGSVKNDDTTTKTYKVAVTCAGSFLGDTMTVISSGSVGGGSFGAVRVTCPAGMASVGGGIDPENVLTMKVTASAPTYADQNNRLIFRADGAHPGTVGWQAAIKNDEGVTKTYKVAVICSTAAASRSSTVVASASASPGSFAVARAVCPAGRQGIGGGMDPENVLTTRMTSSAMAFGSANGDRLIFKANGEYSGASAWQATLRNEDSTVKQMKVAVICVS